MNRFFTSASRRLAFAVALLLLSFVVAGSWAAEDATGNWKWTFTTQNGDTIESTAKLKQEGDKLTGTINGRFGEAEITEGSVKNDEVAFRVKRERDGQTFVIQYSGKISGDEIKGKILREGQTQSREWEAKRAKAGAAAANVTGTWNTALILGDGNRIEGVVKLKQDGDKLTGSVARNNNEAQIAEGKVTGDEVSFQVVREREGRKVTGKYKAKISGDSLKGKVESDWSGDWQTIEWEGVRAK